MCVLAAQDIFTNRVGCYINKYTKNANGMDVN